MKRNLQKNFNKTIGYLLFKKIFLGYFILVSIITIIQIYSEYLKSKDKVYRELIHTKLVFYDQLLNTINNENIKNTKITKIENLKNKIINEDLVSNVSIFSDLEAFKEYEKKSKKYLLNYSFPLDFKKDSTNKNLITVVFHSNAQVVIDEAKESIVLIILHFILSIIIFWFLIKYFTNKYLNIPLQKLINEVENFEKQDDKKVNIKLNFENMRELSVLADAFNKMSAKISEDIINLKQLTMIQNQQKEALVDANKAKDNFLANMSHELKTPLNSINLISSIMMKNKSENFNEKEVKNLEIINNCGNDLLFLINDVLDLSKLEAGQIELNYEKVNLKETIESVNEMFIPHINVKNLDFIFKFDDNLEEIYTDKNRIKQILKNILSNSLKFVEKGAIKLIISDDNKNIKIELIDDGIGISKDKLEHIFQRFSQADASTTRKYGGTGLGLSICKDLVRLFEGDINIESEVNVGTTVTISLPKHLNTVKNRSVEIAPKKETKNIKKSIKETKEDEDFLFDDFSNFDKEKEKQNDKKRIIILNNDPINYMKVVIELKKLFFVEQTFSSAIFLSQIKDEKFDLFIIDNEILDSSAIKQLLKIKNQDFILVCKEEDKVDSKLKKKSKETLFKPLVSDTINKTILDILS